MDYTSHILIGITVGLLEKKASRKSLIKTAFFSVLPDIFQIPYYFFLGHLKNRSFNWPEVQDWAGFRGTHPFIDALWNIPHSILFALLIIIPMVKLLKQSRFLVFAYLSHIFIDMLTHQGEWAVKFLYPLNFTSNGITDAWAWNYNFLMISWGILLVLNLALYKFIYLKENNNNPLELLRVFSRKNK